MIRDLVQIGRARSRPLAIWVMAGCVASFGSFVQAQTIPDYERAGIFQNAGDLVSRMEVRPNWIRRGDRFWYVDGHGQKKVFVKVDPDSNTQEPAFDHARLAAALSSSTGSRYAADALPFSSFEYQGDDSEVSFKVGGVNWRCKLSHYSCAASPSPTVALPGEVVSPDGRWAVFVRDHNLWVRHTRDGKETALTTDGEPDFGYAEPNGVNSTPITQRLLGMTPGPELYFSPDSRRLLSYRLDARRVRQQVVVESIPGSRSKHHFYRYTVAGDENVAMAQMIVFDLIGDKVVPVADPLARLTISMPPAAWSSNGTRVAFLQEDRGFRRARIQLVDAASGQARAVVEESSSTYLNIGTQLRLTDAGKRVLWSSERDGWNHLYSVDADGGDPVQITKGDWAVREIVHVDERSGTVYFTAGGREAGQDPYYQHLYRVGLDGTGLRHLTPEPADHTIAFSPAGNYFIDTYSRLDQPPVSVLRRADGRMVRELQRADISRLQAAGWKPARTFKVKARDGRTDLYGAMFLPSDFDPSRRYPVLDSIYPGPQIIKTPKAFRVSAFENEMALAELGFIVVTLDGMGTPFRSKAFRDASYRNMGAAGGLEDHIAGLRQLASEHPYLDLDRVGIYGHSGGGYASARAILKFPEFYKVAVSSAGNHDQRNYSVSWGERFHDWPASDEAYADQANASLAGGLRGKLLLVHGDMDDNVHYSNTLQLADALIAAKKDFDLLILPNRNHGFWNLGEGKAALRQTDPYFIRKRWDYFVRHLKGVDPSRSTRSRDGGE